MPYVHDTTKFCAEIAQLTQTGEAAYWCLHDTALSWSSPQRSSHLHLAVPLLSQLRRVSSDWPVPCRAHPLPGRKESAISSCTCLQINTREVALWGAWRELTCSWVCSSPTVPLFVRIAKPRLLSRWIVCFCYKTVTVYLQFFRRLMYHCRHWYRHLKYN